MKKFFKMGCLGLIGLIVLIIIIAVATSGGDDTTSGTKVSESDGGSKEEAKSEETVADKTFKVGDTIDLNGLEITIASAKYIEASEYAPSEQGKILQMEVNVTNNKDDKIFFDSSEFNMYDMDGNTLEQYFGGDDLDISGDVNAGKKLSGTLTYDVPEADAYELIYEPTFSWTDEQVTWEIAPQ
ncbi:DUF4352 domain-containing protein [Bacillus sp. es.036]|uniref:DUF4352 domain-containing protein n=1 Tax=Bacillus sp. es.036 TaxID=1761764 RepID=UPI000C01DAFE|nr:DUF4352 domain-containing protein [Bacillus sp. es.036]PFG03036.1 uncharacterized protein DUF4352 [Bacillus sp. es.036]